MQQYRPLPKNDAAAIKRVKELTSENRPYGYLAPTEYLLKTTAPAFETLAVSTLQLNTETEPEDPRSNRP